MVPLSSAPPNGTIGAVSDHRIRLTDEDIVEITSALRARAAMRGAKRRTTMLRLADRLDEGTRGNPNFRLGGVCPHGELLEEVCLRCVGRRTVAAELASQAGQPTSLNGWDEVAAGIAFEAGVAPVLGPPARRRSTEVP